MCERKKINTEDDGEEKLMLIELQKTWVETETLRFRQYLE